MGLRQGPSLWVSTPLATPDRSSMKSSNGLFGFRSARAGGEVKASLMFLKAAARFSVQSL